jgi:hypothetical protein
MDGKKLKINKSVVVEMRCPTWAEINGVSDLSK